MTLVRWMFGLPLAAAVVLVLVLIMSGLIRQEFVPTTPTSVRELIVTPKIKETTVEPKKIVKPVPKEAPPEPDVRRRGPVDPVDPIPYTPPSGVGPGDIVIPPTTGMKPLIRVAPRFPEACASKGVEGVVLVEFDVTAEGNVVNPRVISSSNSCFDRAAVRAVSGWKYPPDMRDGRPVPRYGVTERFNFQLTD
ncbi:MAG: TonB family protein [Amphiplicatus sp.]